MYFIIIFVLQGRAKQPELAESYANNPEQKPLHGIPSNLHEIDPGGAGNGGSEPCARPDGGGGRSIPRKLSRITFCRFSGFPPIVKNNPSNVQKGLFRQIFAAGSDPGRENIRNPGRFQNSCWINRSKMRPPKNWFFKMDSDWQTGRI